MNNKSINTSDPVLFIEDDEPFIRKISALLNKSEITNIQTIVDIGRIKLDMEKNEFKYSFILLNLSLPGIVEEGITSEIITKYPKIPLIIISTDDNVENAVQYMKQGVLYYYNNKKGIEEELVKKILHGIRLYESIKPIITQSKKMRPIFGQLAKIAPTKKAVLIRGESGVGKEQIARVIHENSQSTGRYRTLNVAALTPELFNDTLFGHIKGTFTDAREDRLGLIQVCDGGSLFLDEIGKLMPELQQNLLRLVQFGTFEKGGVDVQQKANVRFIFAANENIEECIYEKKFLHDFYERIKGNTIFIPPLRERKEDIPSLVDHFLEKNVLIEKVVDCPKKYEKAFIERLSMQDFNGNIRELEDLIGNLSILFSGCERLTASMLEDFVDEKKECTVKMEEGQEKLPKKFPTFLDVEASYYREVLRQAGGSQKKITEISGFIPRTFFNRLRSLKERLKDDGVDFETFPPITELLKPFTEARDDNKK